MTWTRVNKHWSGEELDELQARLFNQARKVMRDGYEVLYYDKDGNLTHAEKVGESEHD